MEKQKTNQNFPNVFDLSAGQRNICCIYAWGSSKERESYGLSDFMGGVNGITNAKIPLHCNKNKINSPAILCGLLNKSSLIRTILNEEKILYTGSNIDNILASTRGLHMLFPKDLGDEGFIVYLAHSHYPLLIVTANTAAGLYYGLQTIKNRIYKKGKKYSIGDLGTRLLPVLHTPKFKYRSMATFFSGPCFLLPGQWEKEFKGSHRAFIDWMAGHRFNHLLDWSFTPDAGTGFQSRQFPGLINKIHPNVKNEYFKDMLNYAHKRNIKVWLFFKIPFRDYTLTMSNTMSPKEFILERNGDDSGIMNHVKLPGFDLKKFRGKYIRFACLSQKNTKIFWQSYIKELLTLYPEIDGLGCEIGEHLHSYCQCPECRGKEYHRGYEFFKMMADTACSIKPGIRLWFYRAQGAVEILQHKNNFPGITMIDWNELTESWEMGRSRPRGDWFLYHTGTNEKAEPGIRKACGIINRYGLQGLQIRAVKYREWDHKYNAFSEFTWNPDLSLKDFAHLNTIREERRLDTHTEQVYFNWLKYIEAKATLEYKNEILDAAPEYWLKKEESRKKMQEAKQNLDRLLAVKRKCSERVQFIRISLFREENTQNILAGNFLKIQHADASAIPWEGVLVFGPGGYAETGFAAEPAKYQIRLVVKNIKPMAAEITARINGIPLSRFTLLQAETPVESQSGWSIHCFNHHIKKNGIYKIRIELTAGDSCLFHRFRMIPEIK
ncbi:MAG: hypothetical protein A2096_13045 [Spirochaetes bacterium GWF1_41_5]|nr:MAG: hypothetical protein A2096_13045 [Spirochaetes bacterium GWF1_41_5]HBE04722.1 hypothetical protein [Spirochaetia bacterium]